MCDPGEKKSQTKSHKQSKDQHFYSSYWKIQTNKQMCRVLHALGCWRGHMPSSASSAMPAPLSSRTSQCPLPGPGRQMPWPAAMMGLGFWWWSQHMRCSLSFQFFSVCVYACIEETNLSHVHCSKIFAEIFYLQEVWGGRWQRTGRERERERDMSWFVQAIYLMRV